MKIILLSMIFFSVLFIRSSFAQDTLPRITVKNYSGKIVVSWRNNYGATIKYSIKFVDENDSPIFEINKITEPYLILDKVNFIHAGWFYYNLYESGMLLEKYKFFIPKDGKASSLNSEHGK